MQGQIRVVAVRTTGLVEEARLRHHTMPTATAALGRALTAGLLLAVDLKGENVLTIRVFGDGPLGGIIVTADASSGVRGYVQDPRVHLPSRNNKLDVGGAVGRNGMLTVSKDLGLKEPYVGSVPLVSGEIAEDITYYLAASEQRPAATALGVLVDTDGRVLQAGGYLMEIMPGAEASTINRLEQRLAGMKTVTDMLSQGLSPEDILQEVAGEEAKLKILDCSTVHFRCHCTREKLLDLLVSLGVRELENLLQQEGQAEVRCHFCNESYVYSGRELEAMVQRLKES
ncbi:MAG: Hsp33 family molecular chaperone HslO [Syntrophomonadaceae bacterium]|nr:Hsp33 family molecular chaperone HslO [Syntrophomonadaceae bacterium]